MTSMYSSIHIEIVAEIYFTILFLDTSSPGLQPSALFKSNMNITEWRFDHPLDCDLYYMDGGIEVSHQDCYIRVPRKLPCYHI